MRLAIILLLGSSCSLLLEGSKGDDGIPPNDAAVSVDGAGMVDDGGNSDDSGSIAEPLSDPQQPYDCEDGKTVALYHFDDIAPLADACNASALSGITKSVPGQFAQALTLTEEDNAPSADGGIGTLDGDITVEAWVRMTGPPPMDSGFARFIASAGGHTNVMIVSTSAQTWRTRVEARDPTCSGVIVLDAVEDTFANNTWVHVAATYKANTRELRLYLNGAEVESSNDVGSGFCDQTTPFAVGRHPGTYPLEDWGHDIDELRISHVVRTYTVF